MLFITLVLSSCTYHFANQTLQPPTGIRTAYVERTYDTSGYALNYQILTRAIEDAVASDGKMVLSRSKSADVYIRAHISEISREQYDVAVNSNVKNSPTLSSNPSKVDEFDDPKRAKIYAFKESLSIKVKIEYWDTKTGRMLHSRTFDQSTNYPVLDTTTTNDNRFIRFDENVELKFTKLSKVIAKLSLYQFYRN